ncbi:Hsp20/alpha crystallin family protein [Hoeflea prorocentri]|uniref:Hsp20/alpha crystallin family protein n=1 Tax=Hoeflea prorocentri TaxID=1922333 RepID=A0A9X3UHQ5_9HYPH|nr:Hsp20/alpha crystallin family protein [Hoeflea prorocentri]MCY6381618.1 Hsp20/alpha crystallin family protein [Hoeflea prorocentri]MDA5399418.1 Hsp20/alpha crystallin family protein [Hoeflea prorocentri]
MVEKSHTAGWLPSIYDPLRNFGSRVADWFAPRSDASAMDDFYEITVELPGVRAEDVDVSIDGDNLVVRGEKKSEREESGRTYFFSEREYGSFQRTFRLPPDADGDQIDAQYSDGLLQLKIAKHKAQKPEEKKISIRKV